MRVSEFVPSNRWILLDFGWMTSMLLLICTSLCTEVVSIHSLRWTKTSSTSHNIINCSLIKKLNQHLFETVSINGEDDTWDGGGCVQLVSTGWTQWTTKSWWRGWVKVEYICNLNKFWLDFLLFGEIKLCGIPLFFFFLFKYEHLSAQMWPAHISQELMCETLSKLSPCDTTAVVSCSLWK